MAMGQPTRAESTSWWVPALFWIDERSPGGTERSMWGAMNTHFLYSLQIRIHA